MSGAAHLRYVVLRRPLDYAVAAGAFLFALWMMFYPLLAVRELLALLGIEGLVRYAAQIPIIREVMNFLNSS